jgi:hypothetical protein
MPSENQIFDNFTQKLPNMSRNDRKNIGRLYLKSFKKKITEKHKFLPILAIKKSVANVNVIFFHKSGSERLKKTAEDAAKAFENENTKKHKNTIETVHKEASNTYGTLFVAASLMPKRVVLVGFF